MSWRQLAKTTGWIWVTRRLWATVWQDPTKRWRWSVKDRRQNRMIAIGDADSDTEALTYAERVKKENEYPAMFLGATKELIWITVGLGVIALLARAILG